MFKHTAAALISAASLLTAAYGCSSSNSSPTNPGTTGGQDSGVQTDSATTTPTDSSTTPTDSSSPTDSAANEEAAATCPAAVASADIPTYTAATPTPGDCTADQITGFITACASASSTSTTCNAWFNATANTTCGNCIAPVDSKGNPITGGPTLVNPTTGDPLTNTPGCVAIEDPTHGSACATPLANYEQCEDVACGQCSNAASQGCQETSSTGAGACATYYSGFTSSCASDLADGGIASQTGECQNLSFVITLYCGGGDGGADGG